MWYIGWYAAKWLKVPPSGVFDKEVLIYYIIERANGVIEN